MPRPAPTLQGSGKLPDEWFQRHLSQFDRTDGDIDTLSARIAQVRTLTYIANRPDWLIDPEHWQAVARQVEDRLSDALHDRLTQRFVDRRTSLLLRRLRENAMLEAEITSTGDVKVEEQHMGRLEGFRFTPDPAALGEAAKALNAAAQQALTFEFERRATRLNDAVDESIVLSNDGTLRWLGEAIGKIAAGDKILEPRIRLLADEQLTGPALELVQNRVNLWLNQHIKKLLGPLQTLETGEGLSGVARGIAFQVAESLGVLERAKAAEELKTLDQEGRSALRKVGIRFGAYHIYVPALVKPAPRALAAQLWALKNGGTSEIKGLDEVPHLAGSGRTSFAADKEVPKGLYRAAGFRLCGERCVRVDILERLADLIRPAINYRPGTTPGDAPPGAADNDGFVVTVGMTSLTGCSGEDFASILRSLGYTSLKRPGTAITVPLVPLAPTTPVVVPAAGDEAVEVTLEPSELAVSAEVMLEPVSEPPVIEAAQAEVSEPVLAEAVPEAAVEALPEPAEVPMVEIWHLNRHQRSDHRPRHNKPHASAGEAAPATPRPKRVFNFNFPEPKPASEARPEQKRADNRGPRPEGGRPDNKRFDGKRAEGSRPEHRSNDQRRDPKAPFASTEAPKRANQPDPDSPFAKLLALKAAMEKK